MEKPLDKEFGSRYNPYNLSERWVIYEARTVFAPETWTLLALLTLRNTAALDHAEEGL